MNLRRTLIVTQIVLATLILVTTGLFLRTLSNLESIRLGFNPENILTFQIDARKAEARTQIQRISLAAQTDAILDVAGDTVDVSWIHTDGRSRTNNYIIPNANQCKGCHEKAKTTVPIGPKARNLNRDFAYASGPKNQLAYWTEAGYLRGAPDAVHAPRVVAWNDPSAPLEERARAYLDVNCAHCHNAQGPANNSGLYLSYTETDPMRLGFHKVPVSAGNASGGLLFDLVAGHPEESILIHRMESTASKILMPELGRSLVHRKPFS